MAQMGEADVKVRMVQLEQVYMKAVTTHMARADVKDEGKEDASTRSKDEGRWKEWM